MEVDAYLLLTLAAILVGKGHSRDDIVAVVDLDLVSIDPDGVEAIGLSLGLVGSSTLIKGQGELIADLKQDSEYLRKTPFS